MEKTYYYKVRAYRTLGTTKVGGVYSDIESNKTRQPIKPNIIIDFKNTYVNYFSPDKSYDSPDYVGFYLYNNGQLPLTIYSKNALLYNYFDEYYNSSLVLHYDKDYDNIQAGPSEDGFVNFYTQEYPSWYDMDSIIYFDFMYDGIMYRGYVSYNHGCGYWKK